MIRLLAAVPFLSDAFVNRRKAYRARTPLPRARSIRSRREASDLLIAAARGRPTDRTARSPIDQRENA
jgi:hypothetical protein